MYEKKFNIDNIYSISSLILRILILLNLVQNIYLKNYYNILVAIAGFVLTFIPSLIFKIIRIEEDKSLSLSILFFIFISLYLGTLHNFYRFSWWDTMLHTISGIIIGLFAIVLLKKRDSSSHLEKFDKVFVIIFILSFTALCGVLWEIYEFTADTLFNLDMQGVKFTGVTDTMTDLIADLIGSILSCIYYYFTYVKKTLKS